MLTDAPDVVVPELNRVAVDAPPPDPAVWLAIGPCTPPFEKAAPVPPPKFNIVVPFALVTVVDPPVPAVAVYVKVLVLPGDPPDPTDMVNVSPPVTVKYTPAA